jgi:AcrR family transcriptional regulator
VLAMQAAPLSAGPAKPRLIKQPEYAQPKTRRGIASRERLKAAAREVLNKVGYRRARVSDITARAEVASGLFYRYFADLTSIAVELMHDLMAPMLNIEASLDPDAPDRLFEKMTVHANIVIGNYLQNPGLMRSWHAIAEDSEEFRREGARLNEDYLEFLITDRWPEENDPQSRDRSNALFRGYMLLGVAQGPMEAFNNWALPSLRPLDTDPDALAQVIAIASYRALAGHDPSPEALEYPRFCLRPEAG